MNVVQTYTNFKNQVIAAKTPLGDGSCGALDRGYLGVLWPAVNSDDIIAPVGADNGVVNWADKSNQYLTWVENNHADVNQLPAQGDILIFGATPADGYTNTFTNPDGHTGICDSATSEEYVILQQNSPTTGAAPNTTSYPWNFRPCLGWYTVNDGTTESAPTEESVAVLEATQQATDETLTLPPTMGPTHLYKPGGPYDPTNAANYITIVHPALYAPGGIVYQIVAYLGNGVYRIQSPEWGTADIWTNGSPVSVS